MIGLAQLYESSNTFLLILPHMCLLEILFVHGKHLTHHIAIVEQSQPN